MSKVDGTMYKCDRCGETQFLSCADIAKDGGLSALGVYKLTVGKKNNLHLCGTCYLNFCEWLDERNSKVCKDTTAQEVENE